MSIHILTLFEFIFSKSIHDGFKKQVNSATQNVLLTFRTSNQPSDRHFQEASGCQVATHSGIFSAGIGLAIP